MWFWSWLGYLRRRIRHQAECNRSRSCLLDLPWREQRRFCESYPSNKRWRGLYRRLDIFIEFPDEGSGPGCLCQWAGICTVCADAFVTNLDSSGALYYSTYYCGTSTTQTSDSGGDDQGLGIAIDNTGIAYVTGIAESQTFPTVNAIQPARAGGYDAFFLKITGGTIGDGSNPPPPPPPPVEPPGGGTGSNTSSYSFFNYGAVSQTTSGTSASVSAGYAGIQPNAGSSAPSGVAIFGFRQNIFWSVRRVYPRRR